MVWRRVNEASAYALRHLMSWKNGITREVATLVPSLLAEPCSRSHADELLELSRQMRLVAVAEVARERRPPTAFQRGRAANRANNSLQPHHPRKGLRREADMYSELPREMLTRATNLIRQDVYADLAVGSSEDRHRTFHFTGCVARRTDVTSKGEDCSLGKDTFAAAR